MHAAQLVRVPGYASGYVELVSKVSNNCHFGNHPKSPHLLTILPTIDSTALDP